jgi:hypothetical protein
MNCIHYLCFFEPLIGMADQYSASAYASYYGDGGSDSDSESASDAPRRDEDGARRSIERGRARAAADPDMKRRGIYGGAAQRTTVEEARKNRIDAAAPRVPGRSVPVGFTRFTPTGVNLANYKFYDCSGMRVAVERMMPQPCVQELLQTIREAGPAPAGYVRIADTLVPADLEYGDRLTLSTAIKYSLGRNRGTNSSGFYEL